MMLFCGGKVNAKKHLMIALIDDNEAAKTAEQKYGSISIHRKSARMTCFNESQLYSLAPYRISRCDDDNQLLLVTHYSWP